MDKATEVISAEALVREAEVSLHTIQYHLRAVDREVETLEALQGQLEDNIDILKKQKIIALAQEYKRSREELNKTRNMLILARNSRNQFLASQKEAEKYLNRCNETYEIIVARSENNVIFGLFGGKI